MNGEFNIGQLLEDAPDFLKPIIYRYMSQQPEMPPQPEAPRVDKNKELWRAMLPFAVGNIASAVTQPKGKHGGQMSTTQLTAQGLHSLAKSLEEREKGQQALQEVYKQRMVEFEKEKQRRRETQKATDMALGQMVQRYREFKADEAYRKAVLEKKGEGGEPSIYETIAVRKEQERLTEKELWDKRAQISGDPNTTENKLRIILWQTDSPTTTATEKNIAARRETELKKGLAQKFFNEKVIEELEKRNKQFDIKLRRGIRVGGKATKLDSEREKELFDEAVNEATEYLDDIKDRIYLEWHTMENK